MPEGTARVFARLDIDDECKARRLSACAAECRTSSRHAGNAPRARGAESCAAPRSSSLFDDPRLLGAFRAGEDLALATVYRCYAEAVGAHLAFLARATGALELSQPSAVADLLQDVFARAFSANARSSYDERRPYGPYLKRIARNCFIDLLRKRQRDLARELCDPASLERGSSARDDDESGHRLLAVVDAYVSELSDPLRGVYEQRFAVGLTQKAACDVLGISRRALRTAETHLKQGAREALCVAGVLAPSAARKRRRGTRTARRKGRDSRGVLGVKRIPAPVDQ